MHADELLHGGLAGPLVAKLRCKLNGFRQVLASAIVPPQFSGRVTSVDRGAHEGGVIAERAREFHGLERGLRESLEGASNAVCPAQLNEEIELGPARAFVALNARAALAKQSALKLLDALGALGGLALETRNAPQDQRRRTIRGSSP